MITSERKILIEQINFRGKTTTKAAAIFCTDPMLIEDYIILQNYVEKIAEIENNIVFAKIERNDGVIIAEYTNKNITTDIIYFVASIIDKSNSDRILGQFTLGISTKESEEILNKRKYEIVIMLISLLLTISIFISFFLNNSIGKPIHKLDMVAQNISSGNLDFQLLLDTQDELGRLSLTLDDMRLNLKSSYEKIKKQNDELEQKVAERTQTLTSINEDLEKTRDRLYYLAYHDALTNIANRNSIIEELDKLLKKSALENKSVTVFHLGLDNFKNINDTFGHNFGDDLLKLITSRLINTMSTAIIVGRWSGDEFIIIIDEKDQDIRLIAKNILFNVRQPFIIKGIKSHINTSLGISNFPQDAIDAETLTRKSEFALYEAKKHGENAYTIFDPVIYERKLYQLQLREELRTSLNEQEFIIYYQPKINMKKELVGFEALIRWNSKTYGYVMPNDFIPIAENSDIIVDIGNWILKYISYQITNYQRLDYKVTPIALNLSAKHMWHPQLLNFIIDIIYETRIDPQWLEIEITESIAMEKIEESIKIVKAIRDIGIKIAIDDFGTGFSSFSKLTEFPFDNLKIDKTFVDNLTTKETSRITIKSIINLAHNLGKQVIAEGVETEEQFELLKSLDCDQIQGFYYSPPIPENEMQKILKAYNSGKGIKSNDYNPV